MVQKDTPVPVWNVSIKVGSAEPLASDLMTIIIVIIEPLIPFKEGILYPELFRNETA